jgi:hypothetical protein
MNVQRIPCPCTKCAETPNARIHKNASDFTPILHNATMSLKLALAEIAQLSPCEKIPYTQIAKKHSVVRSTLTRRHQGNTRPREEVSAKQQNINL